MNIDVKTLDKIIKNTIAAVEKGKAQIFDIYEAASSEMENVKKDLERVKQGAADIIFHVDGLEKRERHYRMRLAEVHRNFNVYTEDDMRKAYEDIEAIRVSLAVAREQEKSLRRQRDDLEVRLRNLKDTLQRADGLVSQVGAALGLLNNEMENVLTHIESIQQRQEFAARIIKAQEEERRRVARDIHDGPAQSMANVVFRAEVCERLIDTDIERAKAELRDLQQQIRLVLKETRKIIFGLRPMTLDDLGLVPTVRRLLDTMHERMAITTEIKILGEERRLDSHIELGVFRTIQEALNNVEKHSQASSVKVRIEFRRNLISIVVEDNGRGFDQDEPVSDDSFGILGMRERIALIEGELGIKSQVGNGTKVYIQVPL